MPGFIRLLAIAIVLQRCCGAAPRDTESIEQIINRGDIENDQILGKDIKENIALKKASSLTWCMGFFILVLPPIFIAFWYYMTVRMANTFMGKVESYRSTAPFEASCTLNTSDDAIVERISLRFKDKDIERKFVHNNAPLICQEGVIVVGLAILYSLHRMLINASDEAVPTLRPIFTSWDSASRVLFSCTWIHIFMVSCGTLWLVLLCKSDRRKHFVERILMSWCLIVCIMLMTVANRYTCAKIAGESARRAFRHYWSDDALFNEIIGMLVFISVYTPIRGHLILSCCSVLLVVYFVTCMRFGSADGALWNIAFGKLNRKIFPGSQFGWIQLAEVFWFGTLLANIIFGQRTIEFRRRQDFIALLNSQKIIDDLRNEEKENEKGSSALEKGVASLESAMSQLQALQQHRMVKLGGLTRDLQQIEMLVEEGKKSLENADRLFHFNVQDVLRESKFDEFRDNKDIHDFVAMTGAARTHGQIVASFTEARETPVQLPKGTSRGTVHESMLGGPSSFQMNKQELKAMQALEGVGIDWDFDPLDLARETGNRALAHVAEVAVVKAHWNSSLGSNVRSEEKLRAWVREILRRYPANDYHNEAHAANVAHMALWFATETGYMDAMATDTERMSLMLAALGHDVGHFARNSLFCLNTRHTLAMLWNDQSVLENMHASTVFMVAEKEGCDIFSDLKANEYQIFRKLIIGFILTTDLKNHRESIMKFNARQKSENFLKRPEKESDHDRWLDDKEMLGKMIMQSSDVGHGGLSWELHKEWSFRVICEFFEQGDEEKRLGLPVSPLCERHNYNIVGNQCFFIEFIACSCIKLLEEISTEVGKRLIQEEVLDQCEENKRLWKQLFGEEGSFDGDNHSIQACGRAAIAPKDPVWPYTLPTQPLPGMRPIDTVDLLKELSAYRPQARSPMPARIG